MNVLIVGAHPDDYEIGMAGTICKHTLRNDNVYSVITSDGEKIGNPRERHKESKLSASILGIKKMWFLKFKDTMIPFNVNSIEKIESIIR
ncbi:MAG: PIG-L deacetylase family protein [Candidatus Woesearchaeota archaeon]